MKRERNEQYPECYGHTPLHNMFDKADVYGIGFDEERAARRTLRLGVLGAGGVAQSKYLPAITRLRTLWEPVEVAAVCLRRRQQGEKLATLYGCRWYADYRDLVREEALDGVLVLASDEVHHEQVLCCLEAGLPVLVEKPIARSLVQAEEMCRRSDELGVLLMMVANKRYSPPYSRARHLIDSGAVADPAMFVGKFNLGYSYVDILEGGTIHLYDIMRYLMGDVRTVSAVGARKYGFNQTGYPFDNAVATFRFASEAVGSIYTTSSALSLKPWERVEVYGEGCWLSVEDQYELILYDSETGPAQSWRPVIPNTLLFDEEFGGFTGLLENFLQCIRGAETPRVVGWDGYRAWELAVATHLSVRDGGELTLPLDPVWADREYNKCVAHTTQFG